MDKRLSICLIISLCLLSTDSAISRLWLTDSLGFAIAQETKKYGGVYRRPLGHDPSTLDPAKINDIYGRTIAQQIYDGLVQFDESLGIKPAIAESWKSSRDGLTWTFNLRKGVKFHHGREVTAEDFVYSFSRLLSAKGGTAAELFMKIKGAKEFVKGKTRSVTGLVALDKYTLQITLTESSTPFVSALAVGFSKVVPREIVERRRDDFGHNPIGTGPFKFVKWEKGEKIILEAFDAYFNGRPFLDKIEYRIFPGEAFQGMFKEFESGQLEDSPVPAPQRPLVLEGKKYQFIRRSILGIRFLAMNMATEPLNNLLVRQALTSAIDREWIAKEIYKGKYLPGLGILPPGTYGYDPRLLGFPYDPERARRLLQLAGYPGGRGLPILHITSSVNFDEAVKELKAVQRHWAAVGIRSEIRYNTNWPDFKSRVYRGNLSIFRYSWYADTPDPYTFLYLLFHSQAPHNFVQHKNSIFDKLLEKANNELDYLSRVRFYQEAERIIVKEAPIIVLGYYSYERVFKPYVKGIQVSALGDRYIPMRNIWLDKGVKTLQAK